jgi:hypothetical protein
MTHHATTEKKAAARRAAPLTEREETMKLPRLLWIVLLTLLLLLPAAALAQEPENEGKNAGNYNVKQVFEFGYRFRTDDGNRHVYNTFVNLNPGPRLLEHSLEMRSLNHAGGLFDDFFLHSFGYGGDPNNVTRLRVYKNKWYNFGATFRRDRNYWDYNLLANPLNPTTSNPFVPITESLHAFEVTRRMSDYNLTLLPQSRVRFRAGYSRNINEGPSLTTFHEGTDVLLFQNWKQSVNSYSFGFDFRLIPRTSFSYDQSFQYYKGDTTWQDQNMTFQLSNGTPADLGIIFNTAANQPCATPIINAATTPPTISPTCNLYLQYDRTERPRGFFPTEQLSFQTNYWRNLDISARFSYSTSDNDTLGYNEFYRGLVTRTRQGQFSITGPAFTRRVAVGADFGVTWDITEKFRIIDTFNFLDFRLPGNSTITELSLFTTSALIAPNIFTPGAAPPASCPTITSAGCPQHNASSPADVINEFADWFLGMDSKTNTFQLEYDVNRHIGGRLGYKFRGRRITIRRDEVADLLFFPTLPNRGACAGQPLLPDGSCRVTTASSDAESELEQEHALLFGGWFKPSDQFKASLDLEWMYNTRAFTRITPRHRQNYKLRALYTPNAWASLSANVNLLESGNNVAEILHQQHYRSYGFSAMLNPNDRWGVDFGYDFNDIYSRTNICFTGTVRPPGTSPCPGALALFSQVSLYSHDTHFGHVDFFFRPVKRVKAGFGYTGVRTTGSTLILTPNTPPGPLQYTYHRPNVLFEVDFDRGFTWKSQWGYYGYNEAVAPDPTTGPRNFTSHLVLLSLRYAF